MKQKYALNNKNAEYAAFGKKLHRCAERTKIARRRRDGGRLFMGCVGAWRPAARAARQVRSVMAKKRAPRALSVASRAARGLNPLCVITS